MLEWSWTLKKLKLAFQQKLRRMDLKHFRFHRFLSGKPKKHTSTRASGYFLYISKIKHINYHFLLLAPAQPYFFQSLEEVSLDAIFLSVLSEFVDGISNLSVLAVVEEILQNFQN